MRYVFTLVILLSAFAIYAQDGNKSILVYGSVKTNEGAALNSAHVREISDDGNATVTDAEGNFSLFVTALPTIVEVSYVGYKKQTISIGKSDVDAATGKVQLSISLEPAPVELPTIPVSPEAKVETVFDPYKAYLFDYIFVDDKLLLLVSENGQRRLQLLDENNSTIFKQNISQAVFEFKSDCLGNFHLLGEDSAYQVLLDVDLFVLFAGMNRKKFEDKMYPCLACLDESCILKMLKNFNQSEVFYMADKKGNHTDSVYTIIDKVSYKANKDAYESILTEAGIDPRFAADIDLNKLDLPRHLEAEAWFFLKVFSKPIYCPLLVINDKYCIFDHVNNEMVYLNSDGILEQKIASSYNSKRKAGLKEIIANSDKTMAFAHFIKGGVASLEEIELETGDTRKTHTLIEHRFPEKIKVHAGYAYYLYKELGFDDKYRLYRQKL